MQELVCFAVNIASFSWVKKSRIFFKSPLTTEAFEWIEGLHIHGRQRQLNPHTKEHNTSSEDTQREKKTTRDTVELLKVSRQ